MQNLFLFYFLTCTQTSVPLNVDFQRISGVLTVCTFENGRHLYSLSSLEMFQVNRRVELR